MANGKEEFYLLSVLPPQEVNLIDIYDSSKDLWEKFLELHEGTPEAKLARQDLVRNQLSNIKLEAEEIVTYLHSRMKELITGLTNLGEMVSNRDSLRYALNAFPRTIEWDVGSKALEEGE